MAKYKSFYSEEDMKFYNDFLSDAMSYLTLKQTNFKTYGKITEETKYVKILQFDVEPQYKHLFSQKKYNKMVKLLDIIALDGRKSLRLYAEKVNDIQYFRKDNKEYTPELTYEISDEINNDGEFIFFGIPNNFCYLKATIEELQKIIENEFLDVSKLDEETAKRILLSNY